jgi:tetratricopeptide (TPR) repeat protein
MTTEEARQILGLSYGASPDELEQAYRQRVAELEKKIERAPTPGLKEKYRAQQARFAEAYATLGGGSNSAEESLNLPTLAPIEKKAAPALPAAASAARPSSTPVEASPVRKAPPYIAIAAFIVSVLVVGCFLYVFFKKDTGSAPGASISLAPNTSSSGQQIDRPPPVSAGNETADDYFNGGATKVKKGDWDGAIADFSEAIQLKPGYFQAYNDRGIAKERKGDHDGAIADFSEAIQLKPDFAGAYGGRGIAKNSIRDYDGAIADFSEVIQHKPDVAAYYCRGVAKSRKGDDDGAIADLSEAIQLKPDFAEAYNDRGIAKDHKGDHDGAIADFSKAIQLKPDCFQAYGGRGNAKNSARDYGAAIADYKKAIQLKPDYALAYNNLAWLLATCPQANLRDGKKAVEYAMKFGELTAWQDDRLGTLAAAYAEAGDFDNAIKWQTQQLQDHALSASEAADARKRLALFQAHQPYHADK